MINAKKHIIRFVIALFLTSYNSLTPTISNQSALASSVYQPYQHPEPPMPRITITRDAQPSGDVEHLLAAGVCLGIAGFLYWVYETEKDARHIRHSRYR